MGTSPPWHWYSYIFYNSVNFLLHDVAPLNPLTVAKLTQPHRGVILGRHQVEHKPNKQRNQTYAAAQTSKSKCLKCNSGEHALYSCSSFKELDVESRRKFVQEGKLCFNCMRLGHISKNCPSQSRCRLCGKSHNTLLHVDNPPQSAYTRHEGSSENQDPQVTSTTCSDQVLLQTAFVDVLDRQGRPIKCRALLDSGSQLNLITNSCRSKLGLKLEGSNAQYSVAGTAQMSSMGKSNVTLQIKDMQMKIPATVVKGKLTLPLPAVKFEKPFDLPKVPNFNQPAEIDMIIGAQLYESCCRPRQLSNIGM